jgi:hypothetical protein
MMLAEDNSLLVYENSLEVLPAETSVASRREFLVFGIFDTSTDLLHAVKSYDMVPPALLHIRRKVCCGFLSPLKIHHLGGV